MPRRWRRRSQLYWLRLLLDLMWKMISNVTLISPGCLTSILPVLHRATSPHLQSIESIYGFHKLLNIPVQFQHHNLNLLHSNLPWEGNKSHSGLLAATRQAARALLFMAVCQCTWAHGRARLCSSKQEKKIKRTQWITKIVLPRWNQACRVTEVAFEHRPLGVGEHVKPQTPHFLFISHHLSFKPTKKWVKKYCDKLVLVCWFVLFCQSWMHNVTSRTADGKRTTTAEPGCTNNWF